MVHVSVVAPCRQGASSVSVGRGDGHHRLLRYAEHTLVTDAQTRDAVHSRWAVLALALALLNASLTMANIWPTPFVRLSGDLSLELAACVLALVLLRRQVAAHERLVLRGLGGAWVLLMLGRYAAVTSQSLWGRDINLYWDMPHVPAVGAMLSFVATPRVIASVVGALVVVPVAFYVPLRWSLGRVVEATADVRLRRALVVLSMGVACLGAAQRFDEDLPRWPGVAMPVTVVWAQQARQFAYEVSGAGLRDLGPAPVVSSNLAQVRGADVFLIFVESYGAVSWDRPAFAGSLAASRAQLSTDIVESGRQVVSAYVESPTFGGESWLAHTSLLSGTEVRDGAGHARLVAQQRDTMVAPFAAQGYRTVAIMPGIQSGWPEGKFFGFDTIYGAPELDYKGPSFGWWDLTDQFCLARVDALEVAPSSRPPVFVVFPTISTHTPFTPTPPYQPDWARALTPEPYDAQTLQEAWDVPADWLDLGPGYVRALAYAYATFGGYLRFRADRDVVMILIGDHQPPAMVSGEGAPWDVPVHVIASRRAVLDRLVERGFTEGLTPSRPSLSKMHALMPVLLDAFGDGR